jgi:hypothetical protein
MMLWRHVGLHEMRLVFESGMGAFPPRLPGQTIFCPVLGREYADQIAREWNTMEEPFAGYVLRFDIPDSYAAQFDIQKVGSSAHQELWIPADGLAEFNAHLSGAMIVKRAFFGGGFRGHVPESFGLKGKDAYAQIGAMIATLEYSPFDFTMEISANAPTVFLNYPFWRAAGAQRLNVDASALGACLERIRATWSRSERAAALVEEATLAG